MTPETSLRLQIGLILVGIVVFLLSIGMMLRLLFLYGSV